MTQMFTLFRSTLIFFFTIFGGFALPQISSAAEKLSKVSTRRIEHTDTYHGTKVADPYRWLEDDVRTSDEVAGWVAAQNKVTSSYLESIPERKQIQERLTTLWNYERNSAPSRHGGYYFYSKNDGLQNQAVFYFQESLEGTPKVFIDPNGWSKDGTIALAGGSFSDDGKMMAYSVADSGSDWNTIRVRKVEDQKDLDDEIKWVKSSSTAWTKDNLGFFYSRYDAPPEGAAFQQLNLNQKVYYHRLGTKQDADVLVYKRPDEPKWTFHASVTEDGRYLVLTIGKGTNRKYRIMYRDLQEPFGMMTDLIEHFDNEFGLLGNVGPLFFFKTDDGATRKRVISINIEKPAKENWREIIPESKDTLVSVDFTGHKFFANYLHDAQSRVLVYTSGGDLEDTIELPGIGTASGFGGKNTDRETFYTFTSFTTPGMIFRYDIINKKSTLWRKSEVKFNSDEYETKQIFYSSKDGTKVPMFISHKKGLKLDGSNPTVLYGYGGFNIPLTPAFSASRLAWMELGGVMVVANLRGGGEYGEKWHDAGTKLQKQNVFDDFIGAAEWLIENKYTRTDRLAIQGGSNGGLLVGACMTQRPELFGACLPHVGVMDMLRFHHFTAGRFWVDDYGSSDNPEEFKALLKYSPYHNLKPGTKYPATMVITADTDDRVVPGHSFKFAAALQNAQAGDAPALIRIETRAGHGAGKPTTKLIEEVSDEWAFLIKALKFTPEMQ
jgi:prolyl oligopeptidase